MKNSDALIAEIKAVLAKYDAEIEVVDIGRGYNSLQTMELTINSKFDADGTCLQEFEIVTIGRWINKD